MRVFFEVEMATVAGASAREGVAESTAPKVALLVVLLLLPLLPQAPSVVAV